MPKRMESGRQAEVCGSRCRIESCTGRFQRAWEGIGRILVIVQVLVGLVESESWEYTRIYLKEAAKTISSNFCLQRKQNAIPVRTPFLIDMHMTVKYIIPFPDIWIPSLKGNISRTADVETKETWKRRTFFFFFFFF